MSGDITVIPVRDAVRACEAPLELLRSSARVAIATHPGPDLDGLGSGLALARALRSAGRTSVMLLDAPLTPRIDFTAPLEQATFVGQDRQWTWPDGSDAPPDLAVYIDTSRVPGSSPIGAAFRAQGTPILMIDHHLGGSSERANIIVPQSSSSGEVVFEVLRALDLPVDATTAQLLYLAISYDTQSFRFVRDSAATFRVAAELVDAGADPTAAQASLFQSAGTESMLFLGRALRAMELFCDGRVAVVVLDDSTLEGLNVDREDFRDVIQHLISIGSVQVAATLTPVAKQGVIRLSLRAKYPVNVEPVVRRYGGGGHAQACGATVNDDDVDKWRRRLVVAIEKVLDS